MLRKGRASAKHPEEKQSKFTMAKAMILATTEFKQRSGINSAATYLMDGHSVDLSEELVEQKPSIVRSQVWATAIEPPKNSTSNSGLIRVCWQCPEASTAFSQRQKLES
jgi:hypothetical protein